MNTFAYFVFLSFFKILFYMLNIRRNLLKYREIGIYIPIIPVFAMYLNTFFMFTGYISMCYSYLTYCYFNGLLYFVFTTNVIFRNLSQFSFIRFPRYFLISLFLGIFELFFVLYYFRFFFSRAIYNKNKKIGSDILLRRGLKVSIKLIRSVS